VGPQHEPRWAKRLSREVASAEYTTKLPCAPDGEYVVIQYRTKFQNKADAIETVTPCATRTASSASPATIFARAFTLQYEGG